MEASLVPQANGMRKMFSRRFAPRGRRAGLCSGTQSPSSAVERNAISPVDESGDSDVLSGHSRSNQAIYLGRDRLLVRASWGGWMIVPTFNVDVALGVVRDGIIEPWTTRLVQELLRRGQTYVHAGANFGYYAALGGHLVGGEGRVIAVEANPHIIPYLLLTRHWSGLTDRLEVFWRALWNKAGEQLTFRFDPQYLGGGNAEDAFAEWGPIAECMDWRELIWSASMLPRITGPDGRIASGHGAQTTFTAVTTTIDDVVPNEISVDLIHLDIEGAEPYALLGGKGVIARSDQLRLITEWASERYDRGSQTMRAAFDELWTFLQDQGFRVRQLVPKLYEGGSISVSDYLDYSFMTERAEVGDYVWLRPDLDPWL